MGSKKKRQRRLALQAAHARGYKDAMEDIDDKIEALRDRMQDVIVNAEVNIMTDVDSIIDELKNIRYAAKFIIPKSGKGEKKKLTILDLKGGYIEDDDSLFDDRFAIDDSDIDAIVKEQLDL